MKIITDSTADLSKDLYQKHDIGMVPLTINLGEKTWLDFHDIAPDEYYALLRKSKAFPTTSQPSPQDFINAFTPFAKKGEPVLSIHVSSKLSGTYQSATLAKSHFPEARIEVVDSLQASLGLGMIILLCAEKASLGASFESLVDFARELSRKVETYFSVDSLEHLRRGGRIGNAQTFLGTLMKIKPLLKLLEGEVQPVEKIRTSERLVNRFVELVENEAREGSPLRLSVAESDNSEVMTGLLERLMKIPGLSLIHRGKLGGVITSHTGPGAFGITFVKD
ncbi:MAG: DegV family protein [Pseudomonadota bacterium]